jgi:hypothetical protein
LLAIIVDVSAVIIAFSELMFLSAALFHLLYYNFLSVKRQRQFSIFFADT